MPPAPHVPAGVLIVDDDADHVFIVRHVLSDLAPAVPIDVLSDPATARVQLDGAAPGSLVLMDRMFAGADTIGWLPGLRAARQDLRIVLLSAALFDVDHARALAAGADAAYEKPLHLQGWRTLLQSLVAR